VRFNDRLRFALAAFLIFAVPVGLTAWLVSSELEARDRSALDARLATALRTATADLGSRVDAAGDEARRIANDPTVQRAILERRRAPLRRRARTTPGLVVTARGHLLVGSLSRVALVPSVDVVARSGRRIGRVAVAVTLNEALLAKLGRRTGTVLVVERGGRVVAGAVGRGARIDLDGRSRTVGLGTRRYRASATTLPAGAGRLVGAVPASRLAAETEERNRNIALAAVATLLTLVLVAEALVPIVRRRVRSGEDAESIELVGSALAAAYDTNALLPVILESVVEATGAVGGVLLVGDRELAAIGERSPLTEPLRLALAGANGAAPVILLYPAVGGFTDIERRRAERLAAQASVAIENARQHAIARREATTDPLTGLANRRRFLEQLQIEAKRRSRSGRAVSLVMADLDDFKLVNDRHGHQSGDEVLRAFANVLRETLRDIDVPARLGGEEFAVLLPESDAEGAATVARRLRERVATLTIAAPDGTPLTITASFGVASCPPLERVEDLPGAADEALYAAKREGKDRVVEAAG
jgi:diguanylate cyclase (GGDEF)-like protein